MSGIPPKKVRISNIQIRAAVFASLYSVFADIGVHQERIQTDGIVEVYRGVADNIIGRRLIVIYFKPRVLLSLKVEPSALTALT